ncbi:uncharacterized protein LOC116175630 [Photinus pyralis]|nr:uncharacterized protein LOC116175630 [Photinus pyralis]
MIFISKRQVINSSNTVTTDQIVPPFQEFDSKKEKFRNYVERFENYVAVRNVTADEKKAQILSASVGSVHYNNLSALLGPDKPIKTMNYADLVTSFTKMLSPKRNDVVEQHYFLSTVQNYKQNIAEFVATLQSQLSECQFYVECECKKKISVAEIFLRAQFIRGIKDQWIREQLLQANLSNFNDITGKAIALESSKIQSRELSVSNNSTPVPGCSTDINKTSHFHKNRSRSNYKKPRSNTRFERSPTPANSTIKTNRSHQSRYHSRLPRSINYHALGISNLCFSCGKSNHRSNSCRIDRNSLRCESCGKIGHVDRVCILTLLKSKSDNHQISADICHNTQQTQDYISNSQILTLPHNYGVNMIQTVTTIDLYTCKTNSDKYVISVLVNNNEINMEVDSGAKFSILPEDKFKALNLNTTLQPSNISFRTYSKNIIPCKGKIEVSVKYKDKTMPLAELYIVPSGHDTILGRDWIRGLKLELKQIDTDMESKQQTSFSSVNNVLQIDDIFQKFSNIFEEQIGCIPNIKVSLVLREDAKPIFTKDRDVPYALRSRVEKELNNLENAGIITPVTTSDWGSPLVVIPKPDGTVRLCVDYKCGVNDRLVSSNFPIRRIDDVLCSLRNSKYYCKLDLFKAYLHISVDEKSSEIQTIATHTTHY